MTKIEVYPKKMFIALIKLFSLLLLHNSLSDK